MEKEQSNGTNNTNRKIPGGSGGTTSKKENDYYSYAQNDYELVLICYQNNLEFNAVCSVGANSCEKFLKHIIQIYIPETEQNKSKRNNILKQHSLKRILKFIKDNLSDFTINSEIVEECDGYYIDSRYPYTSHSFHVDFEDIEIVVKGLKECKSSVDRYIMFKSIIPPMTDNQNFEIPVEV